MKAYEESFNNLTKDKKWYNQKSVNFIENKHGYIIICRTENSPHIFFCG